MRALIVDPSAFTPPYDRSLAGALAAAGPELDLELVTSRFLYGPVLPAEGYAVRERFYRRTTRRGSAARGRLALKLAEHVPDMLWLRRHARGADLVHYQWLTVPTLDRLLVAARGAPSVFTLHYPLPSPDARPALRRQRRLLSRFDAIVAHSEHGARRLRDEVGLEGERVHVIGHGAFDYLTRLPREEPLPAELGAVDRPVILFFGLLRPYKGIDVLLDAFRGIEGAELWIVGMPRMPLGPLREAAARASGTVRFVPRFIPDPEIPAYFRRADLVVLPYREIEQSGVLYTALAFEKPILVSAVGGFAELAEAHDAARLVPPGDGVALAGAIGELLDDPVERRRLALAARAAAEGPYSWERIGRQTLRLYESLVGS
jgi:glycosyltransferase involved in cell wall biosynthesis